MERNVNWLSENCILRLTPFDLGALAATVSQMEDREDGEVCEPDEEGNPVPTTFKKRFMRKIEEITQGFESDYRDRSGA